MKNLLARGGIEFIAVLLGITGSLLIDEKKKVQERRRFDVKQKDNQEEINEDGTRNLEKTFDFESDDRSSYIDSDRSSSLEYIKNENNYSSNLGSLENTGVVN